MTSEYSPKKLIADAIFGDFHFDHFLVVSTDQWRVIGEDELSLPVKMLDGDENEFKANFIVSFKTGTDEPMSAKAVLFPGMLEFGKFEHDMASFVAKFHEEMTR